MGPDGAGLRWSFELDLVSALEALGRPLRDWDGVDQEEDLAAETAAQVSLELALSRVGAEALAAGRIDIYRAKILGEAVVPLSDAAAKAVEDQVIPDAGDLTYGQRSRGTRACTGGHGKPS
jgi:hypothetical protein